MSMASEAILMVKGGPDQGSSIALSAGMKVIGRATLNDVVVESPSISRQHAAIRGDADGYWLADLGSRNGTWVNGERLGSEPRKLRNMDRIALGEENSEIQYLFMESQSTIDIPNPFQ